MFGVSVIVRMDASITIVRGESVESAVSIGIAEEVVDSTSVPVSDDQHVVEQAVQGEHPVSTQSGH